MVEIVDAEHLVPLIDQPAGQMIADEPGLTGDEDLHRGYVPAPAPSTRGHGRMRAGGPQLAGRGHVRPPPRSSSLTVSAARNPQRQR